MLTSDITIITASYNSQKYLEQTVDSIAKQRILPKKHLIIDDCSTDGSLKLAKELERKYDHIEVVRHEVNKGFPSALNTGIEHSDTKYIGILDSDDIAYEDWIEVTTQFLDSKPEFGLVGGAGNFITELGEVTNYIGFNCEAGDVTYETRQGQYLILHPGTVMKLDDINSIGRYRVGLKSTEDNDMYISMSFITHLFHLGRPLIYYRRLPSSESRKTEAYQALIDKYILSKARLLQEGESIGQANSSLQNIVTQMQKTPRLQKAKNSAYEKEMARLFILKKNVFKFIKYSFLSFLKRITWSS